MTTGRTARAGEGKPRKQPAGRLVCIVVAGEKSPHCLGMRDGTDIPGSGSESESGYDTYTKELNDAVV